MHIFIDESGTFALPAGRNRVSVVGALIIPERRLSYIEKRYLKLRPSLPKEKGEVKGRLLSENEVDLIATMLASHDVLFEACAIDLGVHTGADITLHKSEQEKGITKNITSEFSPQLK